MIVKVRKYEELVEGGVDSVLREDVYDNIVSYSSEVVYADNKVVGSSVTTINKDGHHMLYDLDEVTIYIMNDEGKTIDKFIRREREASSTQEQTSFTIDADRVSILVTEGVNKGYRAK